MGILGERVGQRQALSPWPRRLMGLYYARLARMRPMHYRLRTLLIVMWLNVAGCAPQEVGLAPGGGPAVGVAANPLIQPAIELEWIDLAFAIQDRRSFTVANLPDHIRKYEGRRVRVRGYMHAGMAPKDAREFLLLGEIATPPMVMKYGFTLDEMRRMPIDQLAMVVMPAGKGAAFIRGPVGVTGQLTFKVVESEGTAILVFHIIAESVEPVQPRTGYRPAIEGGR